jgi:flagellar FliL protein
MAETSPTADEIAEAGDPVPSGAGRFSILGKLKVLLLVALVIVVECLAAYFYCPSATQTVALAGAAMQTSAEAKSHKTADAKSPEESQPAEQTEVDLGEFCVTSFQATSNSTLRIDFHLFGTVKADSQKEFQRLMEENKHRLREQVLVTVRSADITDLTDAGLGLMKRKILDRANRTLGKPLLQTVVVSDFSFVEQ